MSVTEPNLESWSLLLNESNVELHLTNFRLISHFGPEIGSSVILGSYHILGLKLDPV